MLKNYVRKRLEKYVTDYFTAHPEVKLVVVTGSVGKTSTKRAIGTLLSQRYRVRMHEGNHNSDISAPMAILGIDYPGNIKNIFAWWSVFRAAKRRVKNPTDVDVIIQELGTDKPGDIANFGLYLHPDIALVTAVTPEHMEFFPSIDVVAQEELSAANFSRLALINRDDIEERFAQYLTNTNVDTYGSTGYAEYRFEPQNFTREDGYIGNLVAPEFGQPIQAMIKVVGEHSLRPVMGAVAVAIKMGMTAPEIVGGLGMIKPIPGRMNLLRGLDGSTIIDDTYNSSPAAAEAAIRSLYSFEAPQRIAILGDMRELGATSQAAHEQIGLLCEPNLLSWVVTIGPESAQWLAPAARSRGCNVKSFRNAVQAGEFVRTIMEPGCFILAKGSQNTIYAEEAVKILCNMTEDPQLVRQSAEWIKVKDEFFSEF